MRQFGAKVVVTGGAGFVGSHLVERLLQETTADVVVLDNLRAGRLDNLRGCVDDPRITFVRGDIRNRKQLGTTFRGADVVYHLAAHSSLKSTVADATYGFATNVGGTFNVLRAAVEKHVRRVVFASSYEVYGPPLDLPVDESHPLMALTWQGTNKVAAEALCRAFRSQFALEVAVLRLVSVYGERDENSCISIWLKRARAGYDLEVDSPDQVVDFVWVGLASQALLRAGSLPEHLPAINVASGTGTPMISAARRIAWLAGSHARPGRGSSEGVVPFVASVDRMRRILSIEPPTDPLAHLPDLVAETALLPAGVE